MRLWTSEPLAEDKNATVLRWSDRRGRLVAQPGKRSTWLTVGASPRIFWPAHWLRLWRVSLPAPSPGLSARTRAVSEALMSFLWR